MPLSDLNFVEMQNFVLAERFDQAKRNECKEVLNAVYAMAFMSNQWDFRHTEVNVSVDAGSDRVTSLPVDIGRGERRPSRDCTEITVPPRAPAKLRRDLSIACADHAAVACTARSTPRPQSPGARHGVEGPPAKG